MDDNGFPDHLPVVPTVSPRARRVALKLDVKNRCFKLVMPRGLSRRKAQAFVLKHQDWMEAKLKTLPAPVPFTDGQALPVHGQQKTIQITYMPDRKLTRITDTDDHIIVKTNKTDPSGRIERYLREKARVYLTDLSRDKADLVGRSINRIGVRDTTSRWGSCSPDGNLSYSWRLVFAPVYVIDYIVAHEVAHLRHLDHSPAFWAVCQSLSSDFERGKHWIREHGHSLMRYGQNGQKD